MMRTTDLPDQIVKLLEETAAAEPDGFTVAHLATRLTATERTLRTHLLALVDANRIDRQFIYVGEGKARVGAYYYRAKARVRKHA
jgi:MarR-like DNA-binding transcriptional regulator SgrR of sgrS sRNA